MKYIEGVGAMPNSQAGDIEALRRELADLIVQWAGKSVGEDPSSPLGAALVRAVREAARDAVSEQHQALSRREAEAIAEAVVRLTADAHQAGGVFAVPQKTLLAAAAVAVALATLTFAVGLQVGRGSTPQQASAEPALAAEAVAPVAPPAAEAGAPLAPPAATTEPSAARSSPPAATRPEPRPSARASRARDATPAPVRKSAAGAPAGRPAPAATNGETGGQPVTGARPATAPAAVSASAPTAAP
jgi:hypothetical protein